MYATTMFKILAVAAATILLATVGAFSTSDANAQLIAPPNTASTSPGYLTISWAVINSALLDATLHTNGIIPTSGSGGAFGYGIVTTAGLSAVIVATTHEGVKDSTTQGTDSGPIWHNHFVSLAVIAGGPCGSNPQVTAITLQQPGQVFISNTNAILIGIPPSFTGTDALTGKPLTLSPGHNVQNVVSFVLQPIFQGSTLRAVCVDDITPAQHVLKS
jgi:hypothetical protein